MDTATVVVVVNLKVDPLKLCHCMFLLSPLKPLISMTLLVSVNRNTRNSSMRRVNAVEEEEEEEEEGTQQRKDFIIF
jgi:acyl-CoA thioesterase